jgi:hypothetical protein
VKNLRWLIPGLIILILTNYLSCTQYTSLSRKEKKKLEKTLDSLNHAYLDAEIKHELNMQQAARAHAKDIELLNQITEVSNQDKKLLKKQQKALDKFKNLSGAQLVTTLDSVYRAKTGDTALADSLLLVPKIQISFSLSKITQVDILIERVVLKDSVIELSNQRLKEKALEVAAWKAEAELYKSQRDNRIAALEVKDIKLKDSEAKSKSLKKQNTGLKIGVVALLVGFIYTAAN